MPEKWTGDIVAKMHINRITHEELSKELGCTKPYVGMILNGVRRPPNAKQRFTEAVNNIIIRRKEEKKKEE